MCISNPNKNPIKRSEKRTVKAFCMIRRMSKIGSRQFSIFLFILSFLIRKLDIESFCVFVCVHNLFISFVGGSADIFRAKIFGFRAEFVIRTCSITDGRFSFEKANVGRRPFNTILFFNFPIFVHAQVLIDFFYSVCSSFFCG